MPETSYSNVDDKSLCTDIIFWPSCIVTNDDGWVIGWRLEHILVVAAIIPSGRDFDDFDLLDTKIEKLRKNTCFCCTCDAMTKKSSTACGGCTRKLCFETIQVVAYCSRNNLPISHVSNKSKGTIQHLHISPQGIPLCLFNTNGVSSIDAFRQIVLYESSLNGSEPNKEIKLKDIILYTTPNRKSSFTQDVLGRITHASAVIQALYLPEVSCLPASSSVDQQTENSLFERFYDCISKTNYALPIKSYFLDKVQREDLPLKALLVVFKAFRTKTTSTRALCCKQCDKSYQTLNKSYPVDIRQSICTHNKMIRCSIDLVMGIVWSLMIFYMRRNWSNDSFDCAKAIQKHFDWFRVLLHYLEKFPIGFKLNVKLTVWMGNVARALLQVQELSVHRILSVGRYFLKRPFVPLMFGLIFGGSGFITLLCDVWRLVMLHVSVLIFAFHSLYSVEMFILRSSWRLFRGKKRNILRQRTDTMDYDSTQLLFGTILFTAALFLFTTVLVYSVVFMALNILILSIVNVFLALHFMVHRLDWGTIWFRLFIRHWFTVNVHLMDVSQSHLDAPSTKCDFTVLVPEIVSMHDLLRRDVFVNFPTMAMNKMDAKP